MHQYSYQHDPVVGRLPGILPSYWYILSYVVKIPLISCLDIWYTILATKKTPIFATSFQIVMSIFGEQGSKPNLPLV